MSLPSPAFLCLDNIIFAKQIFYIEHLESNELISQFKECLHLKSVLLLGYLEWNCIYM